MKDFGEKMNQNEKNEKAIKIIYSHYEVMQDKSIKSLDKEAIIKFSKHTTEYVSNQSYKDNMEAMLLDIFENGFVFIDDSIAIPVFNIKQFISFNPREMPTLEEKKVHGGENRHFNRWNNKKKFKGKVGNVKEQGERKESSGNGKILEMNTMCNDISDVGKDNECSKNVVIKEYCNKNSKVENKENI